ncbi:MAG TPA: UDP-N-acetylmuramate:L-alanyl-gamma-D-glutamyl-meso-diaminopimelate ligase [Candidatus Binatia bacterium]|nr:UDP-N-acetylmuramate:L-alanyl-gamma-D-glutamyl-meso-diaminopimelate ligase [Candidatus Binatia bacterium]
MTKSESAIRNPQSAIHHVHLIAVGGVAMATLAAMLKERGYCVTGSDQGVYPPMSDFLARAGIAVMQGYRADNLVPAPDLVIVGNAVSRTNPEVAALLETNIPYLSFPQALAQFFLDGKRPLVVAGTHGKTTSTALLAWVLEKAGRRPGMLVGGLSRNFARGYQLGAGEFFVVEGDEYDSAFFDKGPKFLHYRPQALLLNAVEFDHADIYRDLPHVQEAFGRLLAIMPTGAPLLVCGDFPAALAVARAAQKSFATFGFQDGAEWQVRNVVDDGKGLSFTIIHNQREVGRFVTPLMGWMNVRNALGVSALSLELGLSAEEIAPGIASFLGVERRQELVGEADGVTVIDDFAHHPTAVTATIEAVRLRYPGRRLWAVFEPRSNTCRRRVFQKPLTAALALADRAVIGPVYTKPQDPLAAEDLFSPAELTADLQAAGREAHAGQSVEEICAFLATACRPGDVVLIMSNGAFGGLPPKLVKELKIKNVK